MRIELEIQGKQVVMVGINSTDAVANQAELVNRTAFSLFQDVPEVHVWSLLGAGKDDFLLYDSQGRLARYLPVSGGVNINLSSADGYQNVKDAILGLR